MTRISAFRFSVMVFGALLCLAACGDQGNAAPSQQSPAAGSGIKGKLEHYVSKMDGKRRPYGVAATDDSPTPKPLVVIVHPGAQTDAGPGEISSAEQVASSCAKAGRQCIALRATGRGPGSVYQNYGEVDVLEAIEDVAAKYPIDRDRISLIGVSMGGAATWYLVSHYPDVFAAGAPMAGYCDYRLWKKPGGSTFPLQPWEEPSWQARSAAFLGPNFEHTPMYIVHGEWDRGIGGGVDVAQSRNMFALLKQQGFDARYEEFPRTGHYPLPPDTVDKLVDWLVQQKKKRNPDHVSLTTWWLRHNRSYWVTIDQFLTYGQPASIEAGRKPGIVTVTTKNVRAFSIAPMFDGASGSVRIDGQLLPDQNLGGRLSFQRAETGKWGAGDANRPGEKWRGRSGPISDLFFDNVIFVPGTSGNPGENFINGWMGWNTAYVFKDENGGVNRGGIRGQNTIDIPSIKDSDLTEEQIRNNNLLLFGTPASNALLRRYRDKLPVVFETKAIRLGDTTYSGERVAVFTVLPHPENPSRYIAIHGGVTPDAISWGSHFNVQLLPDFVVYDGEKMLDWGFWDNTWKHPVGRAARLTARPKR